MVAVIALQASCGGGDSGGTQSGATGLPPGHGASSATVTYTVTGSTNAANLTYQNSQGGTVQQKVGVPWSFEYTMKDGDFLYISAQNENATGSVTTEIRINGFLYKTTTSNGAYVIATASGSCC